MKLKNKITGEIGEINYYDGSIQVIDTDSPLCGNSVKGDYNSLAELCEEWEDYKEPKEYYSVDENAKRISYNQGFLDGHRRGVEDAKEMVDNILGGEE